MREHEVRVREAFPRWVEDPDGIWRTLDREVIVELVLARNAPCAASDTNGRVVAMVSEASQSRGHVDATEIRSLLDRIVSRWSPQQIWLFGSRARGDATPESDWDLFVVVDDSASDDDIDPGVGRRLRHECHVHADVIPWRVSEFVEFRNTPNTLAYSVATDGVLLHER